MTELDYDNLHIAMLCAEEGKRLSGDIYDITSTFDLGEEMDDAVGLTEEEMEFYRERQRTVVKRALNTLLNASNYQSAYKALKHREWAEDIDVGLANEVFKPLVHSLRSKHEPIRGLPPFGREHPPPTEGQRPRLPSSAQSGHFFSWSSGSNLPFPDDSKPASTTSSEPVATIRLSTIPAMRGLNRRDAPPQKMPFLPSDEAKSPTTTDKAPHEKSVRASITAS